MHWGYGASPKGVRFWTFNNDAKKGQTFALFDENGLVGTFSVAGIAGPYGDLRCFRIADARGKQVPHPHQGIVAYGPLDEIPPKAHAVDVHATELPAGNRTLVGLDVDGDGQADLALAGPNCADGSDGWCLDSYVRTKAGWTAVEHYFDAEGCKGKK